MVRLSPGHSRDGAEVATVYKYCCVWLYIALLKWFHEVFRALVRWLSCISCTCIYLKDMFQKILYLEAKAKYANTRNY